MAESLAFRHLRFDKRAAGIEPALLAWKAKVLPLNYARKFATKSV